MHTAKTTQEWLWDKSLNVLEWPSQSPGLEPNQSPGLEPNRTSLERPENSCAATLPIQPDRAWEDLQRIMGETHQIQVCQACSVTSKKTRGCNRCQRCFNKVMSKGSKYLCKCNIFFNIFYTFANISKNLFLLCHYGVLCVDYVTQQNVGKSLGIWILSVRVCVCEWVMW